MAACRDSTGACRRATAHTDQPEPERRRASMRVNASCHTRPRACAFRRPRVRTCDPPSDRVEFLHRPPPHPCRLAALPRCVLLTVRGCAPPCFSLVCGKTLFVVRTRRKKKSSENSVLQQRKGSKERTGGRTWSARAVLGMRAAPACRVVSRCFCSRRGGTPPAPAGFCSDAASRLFVSSALCGRPAAHSQEASRLRAVPPELCRLRSRACATLPCIICSASRRNGQPVTACVFPLSCALLSDGSQPLSRAQVSGPGRDAGRRRACRRHRRRPPGGSRGVCVWARVRVCVCVCVCVCDSARFV